VRAACGDHGGPVELLDDIRSKTERMRFRRVEAARLILDPPRGVRADAGGETPGPEQDAESEARHAELRSGRRDPLAAGGEQVGAGAHRAALGQCERWKGQVIQRLEHGLDADKTQQQVAVAAIVEIAQVEAGAEMSAFGLQDKKTCAVFLRRG
jgi:hypothetical protein